MKWLRALYDWTMEKAAHPQAVWWLAFFCFIESSFFPIPPHPLLGLMCLAEPRKALKFAAVATVSSVLGGLFGYGIGYLLYESVGARLIGLLGLTESFPVAACYIREQGALAVRADVHGLAVAEYPEGSQYPVLHRRPPGRSTSRGAARSCTPRRASTRSTSWPRSSTSASTWTCRTARGTRR